jgi:hypothetical protein
MLVATFPFRFKEPRHLAPCLQNEFFGKDAPKSTSVILMIFLIFEKTVHLCNLRLYKPRT